MGLDHGLVRSGKVFTDLDGDRIHEIITWRKENHIHAWFVDNVQAGEDECRDAPVTAAQLRELLATTNRVLAASALVPGEVSQGQVWSAETGEWEDITRQGHVIADATVARELLPRREEFFFGSTDYDDNYLASLEELRDVLTPMLESVADDEIFTYWSSW